MRCQRCKKNRCVCKQIIPGESSHVRDLRAIITDVYHGKTPDERAHEEELRQRQLRDIFNKRNSISSLDLALNLIYSYTPTKSGSFQAPTYESLRRDMCANLDADLRSNKDIDQQKVLETITGAVMDIRHVRNELLDLYICAFRNALPLNRRLLREEIQQAVDHVNLLSELSQDELTSYSSAFSALDADGSGSVDSAELASLLQAQGHTTNIDSSVKEMLDSLDINHDGKIDEVEFLLMMAQRKRGIVEERRQLEVAFETLDQDNDGYLGVADLRFALKSMGYPLSDEKIVSMILAGRHTEEYYRDHTYLGSWKAKNLSEYVVALSTDYNDDGDNISDSPRSTGIVDSHGVMMPIGRSGSFSFPEGELIAFDHFSEGGMLSHGKASDLGINLSKYRPALEDLKVNFDQFFEMCTQKKRTEGYSTTKRDQMVGEPVVSDSNSGVLADDNMDIMDDDNDGGIIRSTTFYSTINTM